MRKIANVKLLNQNAVRLMLFDKGKEGVFVFGYNTSKDSSCSWDCHFNNLSDAYNLGIEYGINKEDWVEIGNPQKYCQDDWIKPVRIVGIKDGVPKWGKFEQFIDGTWKEIY